MNTENFETYVVASVIKSHFALHDSTLRRLIKKGMPHIRIGRGLRFKLSEVEGWLKNVRQKTK